MKITIRTKNAPILVNAYPFELEGFPDLAIHRNPDYPKYWEVSELTTGLRAFSSITPTTRKIAAELAAKKLRNIGAERFNLAIANSPKWLEEEK